jgi:hypothetical protein
MERFDIGQTCCLQSFFSIAGESFVKRLPSQVATMPASNLVRI